MRTPRSGLSTPEARDPRLREQRIGTALAELADTLVDDFDLSAFLHRLTWHCVDLLPVVGAGVMLAAPDGRLRLLASSSDEVRLLELFELDSGTGPCMTAYHSGVITTEADLATADPRWTAFAARARAGGLKSAHAIPLRLRQDTIGVLNLFDTAVGPMPPPDRQLGRALADVATIGLRQHHVIGTRRGVSTATRPDVEQAKGILAERMGITPSKALLRLHGHAGRTNLTVTDLARDVIAGRASPPREDRPREDRVRPAEAAVTYARLARDRAHAAAIDAHLSAETAAQARQAADAARRRLLGPGRDAHDPDGPA